jgi:Methyltransferase FkbM domain
MTDRDSERIITVTFNSIAVRFCVSEVSRDSPGRVYGALYAGRFYEEELLRYIHSLGLRGGAYVDVGACIGAHTLFFAAVCGAERVHSVEPRPVAVRQLRANVALNAVGGRVVVHHAAACDVPGPIVADDGGRFRGVRLSSVVRDRVILMKVDVDGMEPEALRGAARILRQDRPVVFVTARSAPDYEEVLRTLRRYHYEPTGKCFNATPTYEFVRVPADRHPLARSVPQAARRLVPRALRRRVGVVVRRLPRRWRMIGSHLDSLVSDPMVRVAVPPGARYARRTRGDVVT